MRCAPTHRLGAFTAAVVVLANCKATPKGHPLPHPLVGGVLAAGLGTLPDFLEPALRNPDHRQFFHSIAFGCVVGKGLYVAWHWDLQTPEEKLLQRLMLVAGGAYLFHLALDALTARSLPLVGQVG